MLHIISWEFNLTINHRPTEYDYNQFYMYKLHSTGRFSRPTNSVAPAGPVLVPLGYIIMSQTFVIYYLKFHTVFG